MHAPTGLSARDTTLVVNQFLKPVIILEIAQSVGWIQCNEAKRENVPRRGPSATPEGQRMFFPWRSVSESRLEGGARMLWGSEQNALVLGKSFHSS